MKSCKQPNCGGIMLEVTEFIREDLYNIRVEIWEKCPSCRKYGEQLDEYMISRDKEGNVLEPNGLE